MDCQKYEEQFNDYLDGELSAREQRALQHHLKVCLTCYRKWNSLQRTREILRRLPHLNPPEHLSAVVMARLKDRRQRNRSLFFTGFPRWLAPALAVAVLLLITVSIWQFLPSPFSGRSPISGSNGNVIDPSAQSGTTFTGRQKNSPDTLPLMVLRVKDFSRADQELESMLRSFNRPVFSERESIRSLRSSSARLIDVKVPGRRFSQLLRELDKIGHLDQSQVRSQELVEHGKKKSISIRIVVVTNGSDVEIRRLEK
jgi:hypothetical protein